MFINFLDGNKFDVDTVRLRFEKVQKRNKKDNPVGKDILSLESAHTTY